MFLGTHKIKLDKKGRTTLPAPFRTHVPHEFVLSLSQTQPCLEGFTLDRMQKISQKIAQKDIFSQEYSALAMAIFSNAEAVSLDKEGRFVMSKSFSQHAKIFSDTHILCVGIGVSFQIWNTDLFASAKQDSLQHLQKHTPSLKIHDPAD